VFVEWLDAVAVDAEAIFLVGDIFDFWFEYKRVIPKGFARLFGKLTELSDRGIAVHFFPGNHDMWTGTYFAEELGMVVHSGPEVLELAGRQVFVGHGDAINVGRQPMLRLMNWFFRSRYARAVFSRIVHPDCFLKFGHLWSSGSRKSKAIQAQFRGEEEPLVQFARGFLAGGGKVDYFVFGHIHCAEEWDLGGGAKIFFLGEWFQHPHYAVLSPNGEMTLRSFKNDLELH
jgi:UDP-2,3-diacylglucosamine hydrolase